MKGRGPLLVILFLLLVMIFIGGVRYGQRVEKVNKAIGFIISLTPPSRPPTAMPTPLKVLYKTYVNKQCPVSFLYPSYLKKTKESSLSAQFEQDATPQLAFSCELKKPKFDDFYTELGATDSAKINAATGKKVYFKLNPDLIPLLDSSVNFKATK